MKRERKPTETYRKCVDQKEKIETAKDLSDMKERENITKDGRIGRSGKVRSENLRMTHSEQK